MKRTKYIIKKSSGYEILEESDRESIKTDVVTIITGILMFTLSALYCVYIQHSFVIEIFTILCFFTMVKTLVPTKSIDFNNKEEILEYLTKELENND